MRGVNRILARAPGKLMLMGEHAVLHGEPCLVAAVNRHLSVSLHPRADTHISIKSDLGSLETDCRVLVPVQPFEFILQALAFHQPKTGCDLVIERQFSDNIGLGSSAAVTVATVAAVRAWLKQPVDPDSVFAASRDVVRTVQGTGSGADVAAAVYGGVLLYSMDPLSVQKIANDLPLVAVYSGSKEKTVDVIAQVEQQRKGDPARYRRLFREMGQAVRDAVEAIAAGDLAWLGRLMVANQELLVALGVSNRQLEELIRGLRACSGIYGAKISGSGLGDCVIGLGAYTARELQPIPRLAIEPSGFTLAVEE